MSIPTGSQLHETPKIIILLMLSFLFAGCNAQKKKQLTRVEVSGSPNTSILPIDSAGFPADMTLLKNYTFFQSLNLKGKVDNYSIKKYFAVLKDGAWATSEQVSGESLRHEFNEEGVLIRTTEFDAHNDILNFRLYSYKNAPAEYTVDRYQYYNTRYRTTRFLLDSLGRTSETTDYYPDAGNYVYHKFYYNDPTYFMIDNTVDTEGSVLMYKQYSKHKTGTTIHEYSKEKFAPQTITLLSTTIETYNDQQDLIELIQKNSQDRIIEHYTISYEYDKTGNWISSQQQSKINGWNYKSSREIIYRK